MPNRQARDDLVEQSDRLGRAQAAGQRDKARDIGEEDGGVVELIGDGCVGPCLQARDDGVGEDVAQEVIGLCLGAFGKTERVIDGCRNETDRGDGCLDVDTVDDLPVGRDQRRILGKPEPRG